jgi:hypothetical protein
MTPEPAPGPGAAWLATRTGKEPDSFGALGDALREVVALAARAGSEDPEVRAAAAAEVAALRDRFAAAPPAGDVFLGRVAGALRDAAERLRRADPGGPAARTY